MSICCVLLLLAKPVAPSVGSSDKCVHNQFILDTMKWVSSDLFDILICKYSISWNQSWICAHVFLLYSSFLDLFGNSWFQMRMWFWWLDIVHVIFDHVWDILFRNWLRLRIFVHVRYLDFSWHFCASRNLERYYFCWVFDEFLPVFISWIWWIHVEFEWLWWRIMYFFTVSGYISSDHYLGTITTMLK